MLLVHARQDDASAAALAERLTSAGDVVHHRRITGLPGKTFEEAPDEEALACDRVVVLLTPWTAASGWAASEEGRALREKVVVVADPAFPVLASSLADRPQLAPTGGSDAHLGGAGALAAPFDSLVRAERAFALAWLRKHADRSIRGLSGQLERALEAIGPQSFEAGSLIEGRWWLGSRLGTGPLATAWKALDAEGGTVVVKVLHTRWLGTEAATSFVAAGSASMARAHEGLASALHVGDGEAPFVVRPYAPHTLEDRIQAGDIELPHALQAILDIASGVASLHADGLAHGDVKPSNVLLLEDRALLADASVPGAVGADAADVLYIAPETQEPGAEAGPAADIYALGMTTLAALHAAPLPFWVLRDPERLIAELDVPAALRSALRSALDWDPARRCPSVDALQQGLLSDENVVRLLCELASATGRHEVVASYLGRLMRDGERRSASLLLALGRAQLAAGELDAARESFQEASLARSREEALAAARGLADVEAATGGDRVAELLARAEILEPLGVELLLDAARALGDSDTARRVWERVLQHHLEKRQAREALAWLVDDARRTASWSAFLHYGGMQHGFLPTEEQPRAAFELGRVAMDCVEDPLRALTWLQIAAEGGLADDELGRRLETIRSARGEWRQVVSLMLERAEGLSDEAEAVELMLRAARVALYAHNHHDDAASIMLRVLLRDPEHRHALRFLARYHARARRDDRALALYARLAPHEERGREGESLEIRVADNVDYARLLLRNDRPRGAQLCLEAALDLNPGHVPTLALTSQLSFDLGKWEEARVATLGLVRAYSSAEADATFCAALRRLGNLAWLHGDLVAASRHYNRVLELAPDDVESWWGRAKIAMAGNAGRLDAALMAEMPWLTAAPVRLTPHEALARLLAGVLGRPAIEQWMKLDPMGKEMLELLHAQGDLVLASAVVDLMVARQLVRGGLFRRLTEARPGWERAIRAVHDLWFAPLSRQTFPIAESYRWGGGHAVEFDPRHHREPQRLSADPDGPVDVRPSLSTLHHESAWKSLLAYTGDVPTLPGAEEIEVGEAQPHGRSAILVLFPDGGDQPGFGGPARRVLRVGDGDVIGAAMDEVSLPLATLEPEHVRFEIVGDFIYVRALGPLTVDGEPVTQRRLLGGERLRMGSVEARFHLDDDDELHDLQIAQRQGIDTTKSDHGDVYELDAPYSHVPKGALFWAEGPHERMLPIVGERVGVFEDAEGVLSMERGSTDAEVLVMQRQGDFFIRSTGDEAARLLQHLDEFMVGSRLVQFRMLEQISGAGPEAPVDDTPVLLYDDGSRFGRPIPLDRELFTLGRGRDADFQIAADASLSRVHCQLIREGGKTYVEDAGSSNGTQLNGVLVEGRAELKSGDVIVIGQTHLQYADPSASDRPASTLHDLITDEPTETVPVREIARRGLPVDEGLEKIRIVNIVLREVFRALDREEGPGRGRAFLENLVAARPRTYQGLLDDLDVMEGLPAMDLLYNLAQRADQEQRPLLNFVLRDIIDRSVDAASEVLEDEALEALLTVLAETRYRDHLRL
ncbi:MAG: FHA domain-containing protein [Alphaproteobacteria bacterium]|nr:FHA domain-containing protein [Alphaproteobacteria bacterium]